MIFTTPTGKFIIHRQGAEITEEDGGTMDDLGYIDPVPADRTSPADVSLAILAGGEGARMGRPKGLLRIEGVPILEYVLEQMQWPGPTLLVTAPGREHPPGWEQFDQEVIDPVCGQGPLRGVLTALDSATTPVLIVATVDMPGIGKSQLEWLARWADLHEGRNAMLRGEDRGTVTIEPFPLVLRREAAESIRTRIESGRLSLHGLLEEPPFTALTAPPDWDARVWINLNHPADLKTLNSRSAMCR